MSIIEVHFPLRHNQEPEMDFEQQELYGSVFYDFVMNLNKKLTRDQHRCVMACIVPALSKEYCEKNKVKSEELIEKYLIIKPEDKSFLDKMRDVPSKVHYVFKYYFNSMQDDLEVITYAETLDKNESFYFQCEDLFNSLPGSYVFSIIDLLEVMQAIK